MSSLTHTLREAYNEGSLSNNLVMNDCHDEVLSNRAIITVQPFTSDLPSWRCPLPIITGRRGSFPLNIIPLYGTQLLSDVQHLEIQQTIDLDDLYSWVDSENKYLVKEANGDALFSALEYSSTWQRLFCCSSRRFILRLFDATRQEALFFIRRLAPKNPFFSFYLQRMDVFIPPCEYIGCIQQKWNPRSVSVIIRDHQNEDLFHITGPICTVCSAHEEMTFHVLRIDTQQNVCKISHEWNAHKATFNLHLSFQENLSHIKKSLLLASAFLLEYIYFQSSTLSWFQS